MKVFNPFRSLISSLDKLIQSNAQIHEAAVNQHAATVNQSALLNDKLGEIIGELRNEQRIINDKLNEVIRDNQNFAATRNSIDNRLSAISDIVEIIPLLLRSRSRTNEAKFNELIAAGREGIPRALPLLRESKTDNTDHSDYAPQLVRNFPDTLLNGNKPSANPALRAVRTIMQANEVDERAWTEQLQLALAEVKEVPGADQLFKRLKAARLDNSTEAEHRRLTAVNVLILDDFALTALDETATADFYELTVARHRKNATIVTSNRAPDEWLALMHDQLLAQSAVDRLTSASHELIVDGQSYRQRQRPARPST